MVKIFLGEFGNFHAENVVRFQSEPTTLFTQTPATMVYGCEGKKPDFRLYTWDAVYQKVVDIETKIAGIVLQSVQFLFSFSI